MAILVLAPTLKTSSGHDHAFCTEVIRYAGPSDARILASEKFQPERDLPALPFFSVDPYQYRWIHTEDRQSLPWPALLRSASEDLQKIEFSSYDRLILHTADPVYLIALSRCLRRFRGTLYLGFMLPPNFWLRKTIGRRLLSLASDLAISSLKRKTKVVLYSETGVVRFDHRSRNCLLRLPPVQSVEFVGEPPIRNQKRDGHDRIKIGFFGAALDDKGFQILLQLAADAALRSRFEIKIFLPPGQEELANKINTSKPVMTASSEDRDLPTYFTCIASVDLVYTLYSPVAYKDRMSGIVQDAILAGRPLLVTTGCADMRRFIDRIAPGAYVHADYSAASAATCLCSAVDSLNDLSKFAQSGTGQLRKLKTFEAYFDVSAEPTVN
jgi:hypothetical protein